MSQQGEVIHVTLTNTYETKSGTRRDGSKYSSMAFLQVQWPEPQIDGGVILRNADILTTRPLSSLKKEIGTVMALPVVSYIRDGKIVRRLVENGNGHHPDPGK